MVLFLLSTIIGFEANGNLHKMKTHRIKDYVQFCDSGALQFKQHSARNSYLGFSCCRYYLRRQRINTWMKRKIIKYRGLNKTITRNINNKFIMYCNTNKKYFQYKNCVCTKKLFSNKYHYTILETRQRCTPHVSRILAQCQQYT